MLAKRERPTRGGLCEIRLTVLDTRSPMVHRPVAEQVRGLDAQSEAEAMAWIEDVSEFDERTPG